MSSRSYLFIANQVSLFWGQAVEIDYQEERVCIKVMSSASLLQSLKSMLHKVPIQIRSCFYQKSMMEPFCEN